MTTVIRFLKEVSHEIELWNSFDRAKELLFAFWLHTPDMQIQIKVRNLG